MNVLLGSVGFLGLNLSDNVLTVPRLLKEEGCDPGPVERVCGQRTITAILKFQGRFLKELIVTAVCLLSCEPFLRLHRWPMNVKLSITVVAAMAELLLWGCSVTDANSAARLKPQIESVYTDLSPQSCRKKVDKNDPNETPYLVCPGVEGYALIVRRVDAGRRSIDVVDPSQHIHPLKYEDFVTRHMSTLDPEAEWRVVTKDRKQVPIALIVRVQAREDNNNPEKVTQTYLAIAKIVPNEACVIDRIPVGTQSEAQVRSVEDSARERPCAPQQPRMTTDGVIIR